MTITNTLLNKRVNEAQAQIASLSRVFDAFRPYVNGHLEYIKENMATKDDLYRLEGRFDKLEETVNELTVLLKANTKIVLSLERRLARGTP